MSKFIGVGVGWPNRSSVAPPPVLSAGTLAKAKAVYGTRLMVSGYTGPAYRVFRTSDSATLDVTPGSDGTVNTTAVSTWLGGSVGRISIWYDQKGGLNLTQTVAARRPNWKFRGRSGDIGSIDLCLGGPAFMDFPVGLTTDARDVSVLHVLRSNDRSLSSDSGLSPTYQLGTESATGCIVYNANYTSIVPTPSLVDRRKQRVAAIGGQFRTSGTTESFRPFNCQRSTASFRSTTGGTKFREGYHITNAAAGSAFSGTGGTWGRSNGTSFYSESTTADALIVSTAYSDAEEDTAIAELNTIYGIQNAPNLVDWDGDSISAGYSNITFFDERELSPVYLLRTNLGAAWDCHCTAWSGGNVTSGQTKDRVSPAPDGIDSILIGGFYTGRKISVIAVGTNDIALGTADATTQARIQTYCEARRTAGYEVIVCNIIPRQPFTAPQEASRLAINAWLAANWTTFADGFADNAGAVNWTVNSYATYYQDGTHPNTLGISVIEATVRAVVYALAA